MSAVAPAVADAALAGREPAAAWQLDRARGAADRVACALPFLVSNYRTFQFTLVLVYAIALLGLNILTGYNGQISLGHGAFYAIGAYVAAILMDRFGVPYWATRAGRRRWCASSSASCSACRRCGSKATTSRSPPSRSA